MTQIGPNRLGDALKAAAPRSAHLAQSAHSLAPGGASHDARQLDPHGVFITKARWGQKIDVDGRIYVDLVSGHGAIMLGHGDKCIINATKAAIESGYHFGAATEAEMIWAQRVRDLVPSAELVRFTSSGSEACVLALALAARQTGKPKVLTLRGHYAGWAAQAAFPKRPLAEAKGAQPECVTVYEATTVETAITALESGTFAALMLEPTGASFGKVPLGAEDLNALVAAAHNGEALAIFDETITGFRIAPGGAQAATGVTPDLTVLGKILGGGLPCGALAGRADIMALLDNTPGLPPRAAHLSHMGTGNGNPVVAATGTAALNAIANGDAARKADRVAQSLREQLNAMFAEKSLSWSAYGTSSGFHLFLNPLGRDTDPTSFDASQIPVDELLTRDARLINDLRVALLTERIDINPWPGGLTTAAHTETDVLMTVAAFANAIEALRAAQTPLTGWMTA